MITCCQCKRVKAIGQTRRWVAVMEVGVLDQTGLSREVVKRACVVGTVVERRSCGELRQDWLRKRLDGVWVDVVRASRHDGLLSGLELELMLRKLVLLRLVVFQVGNGGSFQGTADRLARCRLGRLLDAAICRRL